MFPIILLHFKNKVLISDDYSTIKTGILLVAEPRVVSCIPIYQESCLSRVGIFSLTTYNSISLVFQALMDEFIDWLNSEGTAELHPIKLSAIAHYKLVTIHPFYDGNGRTSRLLMNLVLMHAGYPPVMIRVEQKHEYYKHLETANQGECAILFPTPLILVCGDLQTRADNFAFQQRFEILGNFLQWFVVAIVVIIVWFDELEMTLKW